MAIYYPSSTDQRDASATPFLQEPLSSTSYDELSLPPGNMMIYMNQGAPSSSYMEFMSEHSLSQHDCADMADVGGSNGLLNIPTSGVVTVPSVGAHTSSAAGNRYNDVVDEGCRKIPRMQINMLNNDQNVHSQGLSLSLSTDIHSGMAASSHYPYASSGLDSFSHLPVSAGAEGTNSINYLQLPAEFSGDYGSIYKPQVLYSPQLSMGPKHNQYDPNMYNSFHTNSICDSKFLKAAQQLLDEVVSVQDALKKPEIDKNPRQTGPDSSKEARDSSSENANLGQNEVSSNELSATARQELQNKKSKLMSMLEEVDRRFSQYYHQMHVMVSSFDSVAGSGAAKPYTKLALQTISRHFRCLRDAIVGQIQATRRSLGEQDTSPNLLGGGIPRLRYVDQQIRQQRGLHQLGVSRHSWRPQRGLPESSVTVLRAWLFEHFLHPYPKESEKVMLARQTGLTRGQVANWFINARVRLWKPMVEDMYKEEFGESETISMPSANEDLQRNLISLANAGSQLSDPGSKPDFTASVVSTGPLADFFQNRCHSDDDLDFGLMKFEGDRRDNALDHHGLYNNELITLNQNNGDASSLAQDSQVSLGLGVSGTRP